MLQPMYRWWALSNKWQTQFCKLHIMNTSYTSHKTSGGKTLKNQPPIDVEWNLWGLRFGNSPWICSSTKSCLVRIPTMGGLCSQQEREKDNCVVIQVAPSVSFFHKAYFNFRKSLRLNFDHLFLIKHIPNRCKTNVVWKCFEIWI